MSYADCPRDYPDFAEVGPCIVGLVDDTRKALAGESIDLPHAAKRVWNIQGAAQKATFGDPDSPPIYGDTSEPVPDIAGPEQACEILENTVCADDDVKTAKAIPWPLVFSAAQLILDFLRKRVS